MPPIVIAAGGTGGHLFPAEALAAELVARGHRVALLTDARSGAQRSEVFGGLETVVLRGSGLAGRGAARSASAILLIAAGTMQARRALGLLLPCALVGFGGYPSVAPVLAARTLGRRPAIILHEQNAVLGRANRALSRFADTLALSFEDTRSVPPGRAARVTGNPVRPAILSRAASDYMPPGGGVLRLLVLGGSLGARVFSDVMPGAIERLPGTMRARIRVTQQCRAEDLDRVRAAYAAGDIDAELAPFFPDVAERLQSAHLVVARAGASTVAELATIGRPALFVPLPGAIDDHQSANARALHGARSLAQPDATSARLGAALAELLQSDDLLAAMSHAASQLARPDAARQLADLVESHVQKEARV